MDQLLFVAVEQITGELIFLRLTEGSEHPTRHRRGHAVGKQHVDGVAGITKVLRELRKEVVDEHVIVQLFQFNFQFNQSDSPPKQKRQENTSIHERPNGGPAAYLP